MILFNIIYSNKWRTGKVDVGRPDAPSVGVDGLVGEPLPGLGHLLHDLLRMALDPCINNASVNIELIIF
jgi:hypothetical protein